MKEVDIEDFVELKATAPKIGDDSFQVICDHQIALPDTLGSGVSYGFDYGQGSALQLSDLDFIQDTKLTNGQGPLTGAIFVLSGQLKIDIEGLGSCTLSKGEACIFNLSNSLCHCSYTQGNIKMVNYTLDSQLMTSLAKQYPSTVTQFDSSKSKDCLIPLKITPTIKENLSQIYQCDLPQTSAKVLIQAKMLELITQLFALHHEREQEFVDIKGQDLQSVYMAGKWLKDNLHTPTSIIELARIVGINDNKLKKLFRRVYSQTISQYLNNERMKLASTLLIETELGISDIAIQVGIKHKGHFAKNFKIANGVTPSEYRKCLKS